MTTTKTFMLAALTALSLGVGAAEAQNLAPSSTQGAYFSGHARAALATGNRDGVRVPSGSSDAKPMRVPATSHTLPFSPYGYSTLANPD
jgi:hypothetical protein